MCTTHGIWLWLLEACSEAPFSLIRIFQFHVQVSWVFFSLLRILACFAISAFFLSHINTCTWQFPGIPQHLHFIFSIKMLLLSKKLITWSSSGEKPEIEMEGGTLPSLLSPVTACAKVRWIWSPEIKKSAILEYRSKWSICFSRYSNLLSFSCISVFSCLISSVSSFKHACFSDTQVISCDKNCRDFFISSTSSANFLVANYVFSLILD